MNRYKYRYDMIEHLFTAYLHQDWTIDGDSLEEVFQNVEPLQLLAPKIHGQIGQLLKENPTNEELEELFWGQWQTGYEPDDPEGEDWVGTLKRIMDICEGYMDKKSSREGE